MKQFFYLSVLKSYITVVVVVVLALIDIPAQTQTSKLPQRFRPDEPPFGKMTLPSLQHGDSPLNAMNDRFRPHDGTRNLNRRELRTDDPDLRTIPNWSGTFDYHGLQYSYKMVGTDPKRGSATTVVPVEIIPIRWVFSNGTVVDASTDIVDGQTPVQGIINSPIFQNYDFTSGGVHVGNTQYGDAFQRANFWNSVSTRSRNYHVRLAQPIVLPTQTVIVPDEEVEFYTAPSGFVYPAMKPDFVAAKESEFIATLGIEPESLPIFVWGSAGVGVTFGYHFAYRTGNSMHTYISTAYLPASAYGYFSDVSPLSHEILEWMDDPFTTNFSPGWSYPYYLGTPPPPKARCDIDYLEVADPFENLEAFTYTPVSLNGFTYHLAEGAFIDFFTRNRRSRSVNGQYSFFEILRPYGTDTQPPAECVSSLYLDKEFFTVPGSIFTFAYGMNNTGSVVGYYLDSSNNLHGFKKDRSGYTTLDFPGALRTIPRDINDSGAVVGYYRGTDGIPHGFGLKNGRFYAVDFPGSVDTLPERINSNGAIVGAYDTTQPITHGFILDSRGFRAVDSPFGTQSEVSSINDRGIITGNSWSDLNGQQSGFIKNRNGFSRFDFPDQSFALLTSINTFNDLGGYYIDSSSIPNGFMRLFGYPYVTQQFAQSFGYDTYVLDVNDRKEILGWTVRFDTWESQPFIGRPALADNFDDDR